MTLQHQIFRAVGGGFEGMLQHGVFFLPAVGAWLVTMDSLITDLVLGTRGAGYYSSDPRPPRPLSVRCLTTVSRATEATNSPSLVHAC